MSKGRVFFPVFIIITSCLLSCKTPTQTLEFERGRNKYVHTQGTQIVDARGNFVRLLGFGLGGWLVPEG
ncbi:MAG: hypothetical protein JXJ04_07050, partial [Spirochaetales bacterium]|nr:hypothetical protein [Spirochaetales bacterium]